MLPALRGEPTADSALVWEHTGYAAVRHGHWKLVRQYDQPWELYDLEADRSELLDLAASQPALVRELEAEWQRWAHRVGVIPWHVTLDLYRQRGLTDEEAAG
jgi:arylsulfatase